MLDLQKTVEPKGKGLKDVVSIVFKRPFSKHEQCSGWNNRPLRKAQIHYAALDAMVLVKIHLNTPPIKGMQSS